MCMKPFSVNSHRNPSKMMQSLMQSNGSQKPKLILKLSKYQCEFHHRLAGILFGCCISIRISIYITVYFITGLLKSVFGCCIAFSLSARHTVRKSGNMYLHSADVSQIYHRYICTLQMYHRYICIRFTFHKDIFGDLDSQFTYLQKYQNNTYAADIM